MATYDYQCSSCGNTASVFQSIGEYCRNPLRPVCPEHGEMERRLSINPLFSGLANALAGDRHYDGLCATDGTDISSRTKHRQYMKDKGLCMASDYTNTWSQAEKERQKFSSGESTAERRSDVREVVEKAIIATEN